MVEVFREVRRVLADDGTLWLNLGDSYATGTKVGGESYRGSDTPTLNTEQQCRVAYRGGGIKAKDLIGIPWRVAFALQQPYYTGQIPDERDRTWLAALMDGEGTFTILCTTSPHGSGNSYPPIAQVRMTSKGVVDKAASLVGVASPEQRPPSAGGNRGVYQWRLSGGRAAKIARELYPYLIEKRKQALIAWNHQAVRDSYETKRGVTIPAAALVKQQACRDLIRRLNHGQGVDIPSWMVEPPPMTEPGYYLRSDVIWHKPNPMPESVTDRPTKAHEYLFLLAKSQRYYYDAKAIAEPADPKNYRGNPSFREVPPGQTRQGTLDARRGEVKCETRNKRTVWTITPKPFKGAHFAVMPEALVEPCILAGSAPGDLVLDPFAGSGTVGVVAKRHGRDFVGCELNPEYVRLARGRIDGV
jgi:hypothetical protein